MNVVSTRPLGLPAAKKGRCGVCRGHRPEMKAEIHFPVGQKKVRDGGDGGDHRLQCDKKN